MSAEGSGKPTTSMMSKTSNGLNSSKVKMFPKSSPTDMCPHYGKKGHSESKCWKKHSELRPKKSDSNKTTKKPAYNMMAHIIQGPQKSPVHH